MTYKVDEYNRSGVTYKISRDGMSLHNCVSKIYGNIFLNDTAITLHSITPKITDQYIGELMLINKDYIYNNCSHGSAQLHIDIDRLMKFKIKIPKNKQFIQELETTFQQLETLQNEVKLADELYKQVIQELSQEAIPQQTNKIVVSLTTKNNTENEEEFEIIPKKKAIKKVVKKSK